jgi:hypothetical protein
MFPVAKMRSSLVVSDLPLSLSFRQPKRKRHLVLSLDYNMDAALFGLLWIQSFLKKVANCDLVRCQDVRE